MRLVRLSARGKVIFVGDTHGDKKVSEGVINDYLKPNHKIVFLGDYVDRGYDSHGNVDFLLDIREKHPKQVYLLQGNHEGYMIQDFYNSDFWERLNSEEKKKYANMLEELPFAVSVDGIIAVHGALPDIKNLGEIDRIPLGSKDWRALTWGDFVSYVYYSEYRPEFTREYFDKIMKKLRKQVLIRSHDPYVPLSMYDERCITLFSTSSSRRNNEKTIAIADFDKHPKIRTIDDLVIHRF